MSESAYLCANFGRSSSKKNLVPVLGDDFTDQAANPPSPPRTPLLRVKSLKSIEKEPGTCIRDTWGGRGRYNAEFAVDAEEECFSSKKNLVPVVLECMR